MSEKHIREIQRDEHGSQSGRFGKKIILYNDSVYQNLSLVSGYSFYGFAIPGSNPTQALFKVMRETSLSGEVLFAGGGEYMHQWSSTSLPSINYS